MTTFPYATARGNAEAEKDRRAAARRRRRYVRGKCEDCGHTKSTTEITFWVNGMKYRVCAECIKPYRGQILKASR